MSDLENTVSCSVNLLEGLLTREQLKLETGWGSRTIMRREREGLPVVVIGATRLYPIKLVQDWILSHVRSHNPPKRGRPRIRASG